jgi:predicted secreted protein
MLELVEKTYEEEAEEGLVGAGGIEYFRFKALKKGEATITLVYEQPWEGGGVGETKVFTVNID